MTKRHRDREIVFLEHIARKAWLNMSYANAVEMSLSEGQLSHLILEKISKEEIKQLEDAAANAQKKLADLKGVATEMNFSNTVKYLEKLQKDLPKGDLGLVNLVFGNNPKEAAEKVGKITDIVNKIKRIEDSFRDAVVLFGSQLKKLDYSKTPKETSAKAAKLAADESDSGNVVIDGEDLGTQEDVAEEAAKAFTDKPIRDLAANKFMTWAKEIEFPDLGTLEKAAKDSYQPPPEAKGFLGKLGALVGYGELGAGKFAEDLLSSPLSKIIAKADEWAPKVKDEPPPVGGNVADDLQALGQGDQSVVGGGEGEGGEGGGGAQTGGAATVQLPGIGALQLSPELLAQIFPGFDQSPAAAAEKKKVPIPDLERTVTAPEEVPGVTPELAALINDDPKSDVAFFDPEEAEKAELDAPAPKMGEAWVHTRSAKDWLFERSPASHTAPEGWVCKRPLARSLFVEAIFYKDVVKALKDQGVEDSEIPTMVGELAKRLENQYDVVIKNLPPEAEAAKEEAEGGAGAEDAAADEGAPEFDKGDFYDYTTGKGKETAVVVRDELEKNEKEVQVSTLDGKGGWKKAAFATPKTKLGDEIEDEEEALATSAKKESLRRKGKLVRSPYYKRGQLREVLLGSKPAPLDLRTEDGDSTVFSEHSRWSELAGLEKK